MALCQLRRHTRRKQVLRGGRSYTYPLPGGLGQPHGTILATETFLRRTVRLDGHQFELSGKVGRIELHADHTLELLDYKTNNSGEVPPAELLATDLPTFLYYVLGRVTYRDYPHVVISQLNLKTLSKVVVDYHEAVAQANKQALLDLVREIETASLRHALTTFVLGAWFAHIVPPSVQRWTWTKSSRQGVTNGDDKP